MLKEHLIFPLYAFRTTEGKYAATESEGESCVRLIGRDEMLSAFRADRQVPRAERKIHYGIKIQSADELVDFINLSKALLAEQGAQRFDVSDVAGGNAHFVQTATLVHELGGELTENPQESPSAKDERIVACHEAGHAIVCAHFGIPFCGVYMKSDEGPRVEYGINPIDDPDDFEWSKEELRKWRAASAAGAAAERSVFGSYRKHGVRDDRRSHDQHAARLTEGEWNSSVAECVQIIGSYPVEKLADELNRRRHLTQEEVYEILGLKCSYLRRI